MKAFLETLNEGVKHFQEHLDDAVKYISTNLDYSEEDAREWLKTVKFAPDVKKVRPEVVEKTVQILKKAGVVKEESKVGFEDMVVKMD